MPGLDGDSLQAAAVPELFGEAKLPEITPVLERFFGLESANIRAWVVGRGLLPGRYVFVQGKPAALQSMARQMAELEPYRFMNSAKSMTADTTLSLSAPGAAPDGETVIWRGRICFPWGIGADWWFPGEKLLEDQGRPVQQSGCRR